jgi:hypothetical protein
MMEAVRTSETSVDNHSTRQYNPEDSSWLLLFVLQKCLLPFRNLPSVLCPVSLEVHVVMETKAVTHNDTRHSTREVPKSDHGP